MTISVPDGTFMRESQGVKTLQILEKWNVDVLGGEVHRVGREKRQGFESMKRDPHAVR